MVWIINTRSDFTDCKMILIVLSVLSTCTAYGPPTLTHQYKSRQVVDVNTTKKLLCPVEADPPALNQWYKDGSDVNEIWDKFKILSDGSLRISDITMEDAGRYTCKAVNGFGHMDVEYTLIVKDESTGMVKQDNKLYAKTDDEDLSKAGGETSLKPHVNRFDAAPKFVHPDKMKRRDFSRPVGSSIRLKCKASGNPNPHIVWVKDNEVIKNSEKKQPMWTLKLKDLTKAHSGKYSCLVENRLGSINYTYTLEVIEQYQEKPELIGPHPLNTTVDYGQQASLQCKVKSLVEPHIQWLKLLENPAEENNQSTIKVGQQLFIVLKTGDVWSIPNGTYLNKLVINRATEDDSGMYICLGANFRGYSFKKAFLKVRPNPASESKLESSSSSLPLTIGVPAVFALIIVITAVILLQRKRKCNNAQNANKGPRFNAVPTTETESFPSVHTTNHPTNLHVNPLHGLPHPNMYPNVSSTPYSGVSNNQMFPPSVASSKNHSIDFYTDISSVSQKHSHHYHHNTPQFSSSQYSS